MSIKSIRTGYKGISALAGNPVLGDYESIATAAVTSAGTASVTFSDIPNTFQHLQIRMMSSTGAEINNYIQFNSDTTSGNYRYHSLEGNGSTAYANQTGNNFIIGYDNTTNADQFSVSIIDILNYTSTTSNKTVRTLTGFDRNGSGVVGMYSLLWMNNANAISSILIKPSTGNWKEDSHFALYGIRG